MRQISTYDIFKATYLLIKRNWLHSIVEAADGNKLFTLRGDKVYLHDYHYRTGHALVNPLLFKETFQFLNTLGHKDRNRLDHIYFLLSEEPFESRDLKNSVVV